MQLILQIESAKGELLNAMQIIQKKYNLPAFILDGVLSQILSEIRAEEKIEILNASNQMMKEIENKTKENKEDERK